MDHKIAIIGFGGMGSYHVSLQKNAGNFILSGIWDIKEERREAARERGIFVYDSLAHLLADESVEVVLIATPNDCHHPIALQALAAGKNVICEKPVTLNATMLEEMIAAGWVID